MPGTLIKNIGTLVSGDIQDPILDANAIFIADGKIQKIGLTADLEAIPADTFIDAAGSYHYARADRLALSRCPGGLHAPATPDRIPRKRGSWRCYHDDFRG